MSVEVVSLLALDGETCVEMGPLAPAREEVPERCWCRWPTQTAPPIAMATPRAMSASAVGNRRLGRIGGGIESRFSRCDPHVGQRSAHSETDARQPGHASTTER